MYEGLAPLCNVLNKTIAKVIANTSRVGLPKCISQEQYAFIESCSIFDNVSMAIKTIHHMRCKTTEKLWKVALKMDI